MPAKIDQVNAGDQYTVAATIENIYGSNGGFATIAGNDAFVRLQSGLQGQAVFNQEVHAPQGSIQLFPHTTGIAFRNYVAGSVAVVSAAIYYPREPALIVNALGTITATVTTDTLTGTVSSAGAIVSGTGFTVVRNGVGDYSVTFTTPFAAGPVVLCMNNDAVAGQALMKLQQPALTTGFRLFVNVAGGAAQDTGFDFIASPTV